MFLNNLHALVKDERGVTALEYGLIAGLIAVAIIGSVTALGQALEAKFTAVTAAL
jgi:pilus assembly protein Flp/PilA